MAESKKAPKGRKGVPKKDGAGARRDASLARSAEFWMRGMAPRLPWAGACVPETEPVAAATLQVAAPPPRDPVRAPIDRGDPVAVFTLDVPVRNPDTQKVVLILRRPYGFPSGSLPQDPSSFPSFAGATSVCRVLAPAAAVRCAAWGRYA